MLKRRNHIDRFGKNIGRPGQAPSQAARLVVDGRRTAGHGKVIGRGRDLAPPIAYGSAMFGIEIIDAALLPAMFVALFAGLISFLSPCVLPLLPG